ncbi:MAG: sugar transferase [Bacillota bacterium]
MKRLLDLCLSLLLLIFLAPVLLLIGIIIKIDSRGPVLFCQKRVGYKRKVFTCYKFRTMKSETPDIATNDFEDREDYMTGIGHYLRKYSLDELPQLLNIIRGNMSIVGPRPVIPDEEKLVQKRAEQGIYDIKPGVTGWAQINGRDHVSVSEKVDYDLYYLENHSLWMDLKIILRTVTYVLKKKGVIEHTGGRKAKQTTVQKQSVHSHKKSS